MMAEFQEVMRQYDRMCEATPRCDEVDCSDCVLFDQDFGENGSCLPEILLEDPKLFEYRIMAWAAEHPEPIYPTWFEVLERFGVAGRINGEPYYDSMDRETYLKQPAFTPKAFDPIPADIAEKLEIKPK